MIDTLVLIDDNAIDTRLFERLIAKSGLVGQTFTFQMATDALDFLSRDDRPRIDAILLDINMPRMNGFEFLDAATARFGEDFARIVVFMLTTSISDSDRERALRVPAVRDYFNKPLILDHLAQIDTLLSAMDRGQASGAA